MISKSSRTKEHINEIQNGKLRKDPALIEKLIFALTLLEELQESGLKFVFKGGTSLILLLSKQNRFSTDIDIVVPVGTEMERFIAKILANETFFKAEEQKRFTKTKIIKSHYKLIYDSPLNGKENHIILDILYQANCYAQTQKVIIQNNFLKMEAPFIEVEVPNCNCLLADKLTAFAPHTTGILYNKGKELEIIKQLYDIGNLFHYIDDLGQVKQTFVDIAEIEIKYRELNISGNEVLIDAFETSVCLASKGKINNQEFLLLQDGINRIKNHVYDKNFTTDSAIECACKVMYISALLLAGGSEINYIKSFSKYENLFIKNNKYNKLNYIKKINVEAFAYAYEAISILEKTNN